MADTAGTPEKTVSDIVEPRAPEISDTVHDTSQSTKSVVYKGTKVQDETILDFYTRLNRLRSVAGVSSLTAPSLANKVVTVKEGVEDVYSAITSTKNDISKLSGSVLKAPTIPAKGKDLLIATNNVAILEKNIGTLENFCITFTPSCTTNNSSNRTTFTAANSSNKVGFFNAHRSGFKSSNFVVGNSSNRSGFFSSKCGLNYPHTWFPFHSPRCGSGRSSNWSSNNKSFATTINSGNFSGRNGSNFAGNATAVTHGNTTHWGTNTAANAANWSGNNASNFASNFAANAATCTVVHTTFTVR